MHDAENLIASIKAINRKIEDISRTKYTLKVFMTQTMHFDLVVIQST